MKKLCLILSLFLLSFTLAACATSTTQNANTPQAVAVRAVKALYTGDTDTLLALMKMPSKLKNKVNAKDILRGKIKMFVSIVHTKSEAKGGVISITAGETTYSDAKKRARVKITIQYKNGEETIKPTLTLVGNRWLISEKK